MLSDGDNGVFQDGITALSVVRDVKGFSSGVSGSSWATPVEATRSVRSQSIIGIDASSVDCRSALPLACAQNVSHQHCFRLISHVLNYLTVLIRICQDMCVPITSNAAFYIGISNVIICFMSLILAFVMVAQWHSRKAIGLAINRSWVQFPLGQSCVTTFRKLFAFMCVCHKAV